MKKIVKEVDKIYCYDYENLLLKCIYKCIEQRICSGFNIEYILENMLDDIYFSNQFIELSENKKFFPIEYDNFYNKHKSKIITKIYETIINNAGMFISYDEETYLKGLMKYTIPEIFKIFKLDYNKEFVDEFYNVTYEKLPYVEKEKYTKEEKKHGLDIPRLERKEEKEIIEREKRKFLDSLYDETVELDEIEEFLHKNLNNKKMITQLLKIFSDYEKNYIRGFMEDDSSLQLLVNLLNKIDRIPTNSKDFFDSLLEYIKDYGIIDEEVEGLKKIAYIAFEEDRDYIYKKELLEYLTEENINQMLEINFIYKVRSKYHFCTIYLHLYLALVELVKNNGNLSIIYNDFKGGSFSQLFYDICYTYSDIDLEKFNVRFLKAKIDNFYTYLLTCSKILEKNPKENLKMAFTQK